MTKGCLLITLSHRGSIYGWEIDHIKPKKDGGSDDLSNLRPLQWEANLDTSPLTGRNSDWVHGGPSTDDKSREKA